jgi:hypothetical protein
MAAFGGEVGLVGEVQQVSRSRGHGEVSGDGSTLAAGCDVGGDFVTKRRIAGMRWGKLGMGVAGRWRRSA